MNCLYENDTCISGFISVRWTESMWFSSFFPNLIKNDGQKTTKTIRVNVNKEVVMLLLLLSCFSHVQLCATPQMAAHQAPPSLQFSGQEHWSGLPFPSPMNESEKLKWSRSVISDSSRPHGLQPTRLLRPWDFPGKSTGVGCLCLLWHSD